MTTADAQQLIDYHYWARDRVLDAVAVLTPEQFMQDLKSSFKSVRDTCVHTYSAEWIWHSRWNGVSPSVAIPFDRFPDVAALRAAWVDLETHVRSLIGELGEAGLTRDLGADSRRRRLRWRLAPGAPRGAGGSESPPEDILMGSRLELTYGVRQFKTRPQTDVLGVLQFSV